MLDPLIGGSAAAGMMGVSRADHVWRAIARHGEDYPGRIAVVEIGRSKAVRRSELEAFVAWYVENVRAGSPRWNPEAVARREAERREALETAGGRRAALRAAIARIERRTN